MAFFFTHVKYKYLWYIILLLPIFIFRDYTPSNELKYISIALESLQNNTWFTFYNHGEIYADKPPLFLWLLKISILLTGNGNLPMCLAGLFSLLPAIGVLVVMDKWMEQEGGIINPFIANLLLLTSIMFLASSLVVRMDMLMLFFIVLSLYSFYRIYKNINHPTEEYLLPVFIFLALFSKGPIGLLATVGSIVTFLLIKGEIRTLGRYLGWKQWLILSGLCLLWFLGVYWEGGTTYLYDLVFRQTVGRGINAFHHKEPLWYYFPRMLWSFAPWSILLIILFTKGSAKKYFETDLRKFFFVIIVFNLILLSLISSKLDIYLLPIYPFVIYLACLIYENEVENTLMIRLSIYVPAILISIVCISVLLFGDKLLSTFNLPFRLQSLLLYLIIFLLLSVNITTVVLLSKKQIDKAIVTFALGLICTLTVGAFYLPQVNEYIGYKEIAKSAKEYEKTSGAVHYMSYKSRLMQNMDVYLNNPVLRIETIMQIDSIDRTNTPCILFVINKEISRNEELKEYLSKYPCGKNGAVQSWFLIGAQQMKDEGY